MRIGVVITGLAEVKRQIASVEKQARFATAVALTRTAQHAQRMTADEMARQFDRPTRTTLRSMFVRPATKANLTAMVYVKDRPLGGKNPLSMAEIIGHQFRGGGRIATNFEQLLRREGFLGSGEFVVPGAAAKLNRYGNISTGQLVQVMSQIGIRRAGSDSTPTNSKRSKRNVQRAGEIFWSMGVGGSTGRPLIDADTGIQYGTTGRSGRANHLPKGAWMRAGRNVRPILLVVKGAPGYRRRIDLVRIAQSAVRQHFNNEFATAFLAAKRTAR